MTFSLETLALMNRDCNAGKVQFSGNFGTEYLAESDLTVYADDLLSEASSSLTALGQCGEVERPVEDSDFIAQIDIDLLPVNGGHGQLGESNQTSSSECVVHWTDGRSQNMDGGGSITIGPVKQGAAYKKSNFSHVEISEGSGVKISYVVASQLVKLT